MYRCVKKKIAERYGGKRALLTFVLAQARMYATGLARPLLPDLKSVKRLVFVCQGNICRSPFAEKLALAQGIPAISFGLAATSGTAANPTALEVAQIRGVSLETHQSLNIMEYAPLPGDLVLCFLVRGGE